MELWEEILKLILMDKGEFNWEYLSDLCRVCKIFEFMVWRLYPRDEPLYLFSTDGPEKAISLSSHLGQVCI
jgi:hypothetical protein